MSLQKIIAKMIDNLYNDNISALEKNSIEYKNYLSNLNPNPSVISNAFGINGLYYIPNYLSDIEIVALKKIIDNEIKLESISANENSRMVAHMGFYYSYDRSGLKQAIPIPDKFKKLVNPSRINKLIDNLIDKEFEQVIINEYKPGQQISYHTDHVKLFGPIIACITVGESVPIKFKFGNTIKKVNVAEGSLYIMTDEARYKWQHSLKNTKHRTRYSITYRTINNN